MLPLSMALKAQFTMIYSAYYSEIVLHSSVDLLCSSCLHVSKHLKSAPMQFNSTPSFCHISLHRHTGWLGGEGAQCSPALK